MPRRNKVLNVGDSAPLFTLQSAQRENVSLASYRNRRHVILTFFRGTWCPNSRRQLGDLQTHLNEYIRFGAVVIAVAGQWPREVRRYVERHGITFPLLIDKHRTVIKSYGVYHWLGLDAYNIARPSIFIVDKEGIIRFIHVGSHQFDLPKHASLVACVESLE